MTKATRIINKYHIKEMLLNGNPQFENFYKEELIQFCEVARELLKQYQKENQELKKQLEEKQNPLQGIFAQVNDDTLLRDCGNMNAEINGYKTQQKEFIEFLEAMSRMYQNEYKDINTAEHYNCVLQKYKEIIGVKDENKRN